MLGVVPHVSLLYAPSLPGASRVARYLGAFDQPCLACGNVLEGKDDPKAHVCSTPQCKGIVQDTLKCVFPCVFTLPHWMCCVVQ